MKCFIAQPMANLSKENIQEVRQNAIDILKVRYGDINIINSYIDCTNQNYPWLLGNALIQLSNADLVFFTKGWENCLGCIVEYESAKRIGAQLIFEENLFLM